jgi:hypothetical protein
MTKGNDMPDPASDSNKDKPDEEIAQRARETDIAKVTEDDAKDANEQPKSSDQGTGEPKKPRIMLRAGRTVCQWWDDLKKPEVSNRLVATATVVIAVASGLTWHEMRNGSNQTDSIIAADQRIATAMENSNLQAQTAFANTTQQAEIAQRAWLNIEVHPLSTEHYAADKPFPTRFRALNVGHSPALDLKRVTYAIKVYKQQNPTFALPVPFYSATDLVPSGNLVPGGFIYSDVTFLLNSTDVRDIDDGALRLYVYGRVDYSDVFGTTHWTNFCDYLLSGGDFAICSEYSQMDNNQPQVHAVPMTKPN